MVRIHKFIIMLSILAALTEAVCRYLYLKCSQFPSVWGNTDCMGFDLVVLDAMHDAMPYSVPVRQIYLFRHFLV